MREIKFRAKSATTNRWVYGHYAFTQGHHVIYEDGEPFVIVLSTLGQYTGLKDRDGVEIYEGDILYAIDIKNPYFWEQHGSGKCVIEWQDGSFVTRYKEKKYPDSMLESAECFNKFEIIGNIYENIGLLEEAE